MSVPLTLNIKNLRLAFRNWAGTTEVLHGIDLTISKGERVALVGESGSGKSVTSRIVLGTMQDVRTARVSGQVAFEGTDLSAMTPKARRNLRGRDMSMIFQDPTTALNPCVSHRRFVSRGFEASQSTDQKGAGPYPCNKNFARRLN